MPTGAAAAQAGTTAPPKQQQNHQDKGPGSVSGNLTQDPDLNYTGNGKPVATIRLATAERVKNPATGQWENGPTVFYTVRAWGNLAENVAEYLTKGARVVAEGRWREETWQTDEGPKSRIVLVATDLGPSMMFHGARIVRPERNTQLWPVPESHASGAITRIQRFT